MHLSLGFYRLTFVGVFITTQSKSIISDMGILITILIVAFWIYNYFKFRRMNSYYKVMVSYLIMEVQNAPSRDLMLRLSSALIHIQHYRDAYEILIKLSNGCASLDEEQKIRANMEFCKNPVTGLSEAKNLNHSYWHNFLLVRLGKRRYDFLTEQDYLMTNSIQRKV